MSRPDLQKMPACGQSTELRSQSRSWTVALPRAGQSFAGLLPQIADAPTMNLCFRRHSLPPEASTFISHPDTVTVMSAEPPIRVAKSPNRECAFSQYSTFTTVGVLRIVGVLHARLVVVTPQAHEALLAPV
mmetsp:Transcript_3527/g.7128  ORF Transcript_3527/g.7128 Transcript_3527/m.7128 type:complete len:131 (-) Transcript_3527:883-1275(-)